MATPLPTVVIADKQEIKEPSTGGMESQTEDPNHDEPTQPAASPSPLEASKEPLPSWSDDDEMERTQPPAIAAPRYGAPGQPVSTLVMLALAGIASLLAVVIVVLVVTRARDSTTPAPPIGVAPVPTTSPEPGVSRVPSSVCKIVKRPKRVAPSILQGVPPYLSSVPGSGRVAVGIATSRAGAAGLTLDPESLDTARTFDEPRGKPVLGVVPVTGDGVLSFVVDRDDAPLRFARTVDGKPSFMIGVSDDGFARVIDKKRPETLWPGEGDKKITEPRIAAVPGQGFALSFRRGGQTGQVIAGFLGLDGSRKSELSAVDTRHRFLGTPMVAANDRDVVIAFAARPTEAAYWTIQLASARHGELPKAVKDLAIPPGGPGSEAISPAMAGLPSGRWFVQWTEGSSGQRQVRGQMLGTDLAPNRVGGQRVERGRQRGPRRSMGSGRQRRRAVFGQQRARPRALGSYAQMQVTFETTRNRYTSLVRGADTSASGSARRPAWSCSRSFCYRAASFSVAAGLRRSVRAESTPRATLRSTSSSSLCTGTRWKWRRRPAWRKRSESGSPPTSRWSRAFPAHS